MAHGVKHPLAEALQHAEDWLRDVQEEFDTEDTAFVYRIVRAWLHGVRDRLPVVEAAHFGAQLPDLLRGVYYQGWNPARVPVKIGAEEFVEHFAAEARVARVDVPKIVWAVSDALNGRITNLPKVLRALPLPVRTLVSP